ncbi:MAG TPA: response regulator [Candidatus Deferrimicrobium sp.]|nr:response regulator [Candidatus Deferrimicrobium sp.]
MPKKLLLAEDSLTIRKAFDLALSRSDIEVTAVGNGEDAVRLAGEILPDLVVVDLTLQGKDGLAVAAELRAGQRTERIPVLVLSGTLAPLDNARFKDSGARGVLYKPFESRELLESIERLLREGPSAPEPPKRQEAPADDARWDFSDVLSEAEAGAGKSAAPASAAGERLLPGAILPGGVEATSALNEYDVSIDELDGPAPDFSAELSHPEPAAKVEHIESDLSEDSPPPVTDLSPALEEIEEIEEVEEVEHLEAVEAPLPPVVAEPVVADLAAEPAAEEMLPPSPASSAAPSGAAPRPEDAELREFFAGRAEEIFRAVASEAVEKVMWEMTDRLAAEFSAKIRESVEAVAWEVIPSTAEALIREEIARIRGLAGKSSP